jgi:LuxR family maltose regulon positive regulatory protein
MTEIRQTDLRMDLREGDEFFNQVCNLGLSPENIQMLVSRADGWVAGLQMASLALKDRENPSEYIQSFSGSHDYIVDFLTTEVLQGQPESTQKFLMRTSILDRLSAPLCEAVTGDENSHHILRRLMDENIFLQSLDDQHQWFAYHRLFRDLLTQRLLETGAGEVSNLYLEASQWCEVNGFPNDAIDYAIRGQHIHRATDLVEKQAQTTILQSEIVTFIRWIEQLPEEEISSKPALGIYYAWALFVSNQRTDIANRVLEQVVPTDENQEGHLLAVKSIQAAFQRDVPGAIQQARQALGQLPEDDYFFRQISAWNLSACLFLAGDDKEGAKVLEEVARVSLASGNRLVAIVSLCRLGAIHIQKGDLPKAQASYQQALDVASENRKKPLPAACEAMFGLGKVHWEWFEFEIARQHFFDGIELCQRWREVTSIEGRINLAFLLQSQGDRDGASQSMDTALRIASQDAYTETRVQYVASQQAYLNLRQGKLPAAAEWTVQRELEKYLGQEKLESTGQIGADLIRNFELVIFARILIAQKRYAEATQILGWLRPAFEQIEHRVKMIENHILTGAVLEAQGKTAQAIASIEEALRLAAPAGYIRIFWDEGPAVIDLVRKVKPHEAYADFRQRLLSADATGVKETVKPESTSDLVEPLSERETEVLGLLQSELSAPEIATQIHVSVSTLRTHIKNIYAKLGVHSRFEAVTKGRDLGLI